MNTSLFHTRLEPLVSGIGELVEARTCLLEERRALLEQRHLLLEQRMGLLEQLKHQQRWLRQVLSLIGFL